VRDYARVRVLVPAALPAHVKSVLNYPFPHVLQKLENCTFDIDSVVRHSTPIKERAYGGNQLGTVTSHRLAPGVGSWAVMRLPFLGAPVASRVLVATASVTSFCTAPLKQSAIRRFDTFQNDEVADRMRVNLHGFFSQVDSGQESLGRSARHWLRFEASMGVLLRLPTLRDVLQARSGATQRRRIGRLST
jgi:hypothetical protein